MEMKRWQLPGGAQAAVLDCAWVLSTRPKAPRRASLYHPFLGMVRAERVKQVDGAYFHGGVTERYAA